MGNSSKRDIRKMGIAAKRKTALELRQKGMSYLAIAQEMKLAGRQTAHKLVQAAITAIPLEAAMEVKTLELARLDAMFAVAYPKALEGDMAALDRALRLMERRSNLLGLDAPKAIRFAHEMIERNLNAALSKLESVLPAEYYAAALRAFTQDSGGEETPTFESFN